MQPITIFCAFSRPWVIDAWLDDLAALDINPAQINLCVIVDGEMPYVLRRLREFAIKNKYRNFRSAMNDEWEPNETRIAIRRQRVADIKNQSKNLISETDGRYIIGLEDDTVFGHIGNFDRLLQPIIDDDRIGFVEGVQMGRWGAHMVGVWETDNAAEPGEVNTMLPTRSGDGALVWQGRREISAGGFYGYATQRELYLNHDYYSSSSQPWGPDVNFGLWLRQKGYTCLVDWSMVFGHNDHGQVAYPDREPYSRQLTQVVYTKNRDIGRWERTDYDQNDRY